MVTLELILVGLACLAGGFVAGWLSAAHRARQRIARIEQFRQAALAEARRDPLTGLWNRRSFEEQLAHHAAVSRRYGAPLALVLIDVDDLKATNDKLGYAAGDDLLRRLAEQLGRTIRQADLAFRFGGDEFALLLLQSEPGMARAFINRLRQQLQLLPAASAAGVQPAGDESAPLIVSAGIACLPGAATARDLVAQADRALKRAKEAGSGKAFVFSESGILEVIAEASQAAAARGT